RLNGVDQPVQDVVHEPILALQSAPLGI
ncbi:MAG: hypothetical protein RI987_462, partial [Actinomycetota bacterium]